jgi:uncharacterized repeat protein (TIGR01451 family)
LIYSTYLEGSRSEAAYAIAVDSLGKAYVTGITNSRDFPIKNAFQPTYKEWLDDVFVSKFNQSGSALEFSSYLGGTYDDHPYGMGLDSNENIYVTGYTGSPDFPVAGQPFQLHLRKGYDAFVSKIDPVAGKLVYSTYLGGSESDWGTGIVVDEIGNAYVTGATGSFDFPIAGYPFQRVKRYAYDAFVSKLNSTGSGLLYSTFLGAEGEDYGTSVAVDRYHQIYVAGITNSAQFPTYNSMMPYPGISAFVTTLKTNPTNRIAYYSTYLGPISTDSYFYPSTLGIAVDRALNVYVAGGAIPDFPVTAGAFQTQAASYSDLFISKLMISADLSLTDSAPGTVRRYDNLTYTLTGVDNGPDSAVDLRLRDPIPAGTTFVSYSVTEGTCSAPQVGTSGTLDCSLARLNPGKSWIVQMVVNVNAEVGTQITNTATLNSKMQDLVPGNNTAVVTTKVIQ